MVNVNNSREIAHVAGNKILSMQNSFQTAVCSLFQHEPNMFQLFPYCDSLADNKVYKSYLSALFLELNRLYLNSNGKIHSQIEIMQWRGKMFCQIRLEMGP